jgi:hypothetical protein
MMEWPEGIAGLQTGCRAGVHARIGSGSVTKSHSLGTIGPAHKYKHRAPSISQALSRNGWEGKNTI